MGSSQEAFLAFGSNGNCCIWSWHLWRSGSSAGRSWVNGRRWMSTMRWASFRSLVSN